VQDEIKFYMLGHHNVPASVSASQHIGEMQSFYWRRGKLGQIFRQQEMSETQFDPKIDLHFFIQLYLKWLKC